MRQWTVQERNIFRLHLDTALQGIASAGTAVYLSVYLVHAGAQPIEVALLSSLPALMMVLLAVPAAAYVDRQRDLVQTVVRVRFVYYLGSLAVALLLATPLGRLPLAVVATWALFSTAFSAFQPAWMAAMANIVPRGRMLAVTGDRWAVNGAVAAAVVAAFGLLLDRLAFPFNYQVVFSSSFVAALLALHFYKGIRIPYRIPSPSAGQRVGERLQVMGRALIDHRDFMRFLLAAFVYQMATWLPEGLFSVFWVRDLAASDSLIGIRTMAFNLTLMLGYFILGRMTGRLGRRRVLVLATAAVGLYPAFTALAPTAAWLVPIAAVRGLFSAGIEIVLFEALLAKSPSEHRPGFVAASSMLDNLAHLLAPLLGAGLAALWDIRAAMFIGSAAYLIAAVLFQTLTFGAMRDRNEKLVDQPSPNYPAESE
jgi:MFS family permease